MTVSTEIDDATAPGKEAPAALARTRWIQLGLGIVANPRDQELRVPVHGAGCRLGSWWADRSVDLRSDRQLDAGLRHHHRMDVLTGVLAVLALRPMRRRLIDQANATPAAA